jgi:hypothetical protein
MKRGVKPTGVFVKHYRPVSGDGILGGHIFFYTGDAFFFEPLLYTDLFVQLFLFTGKEFSLWHLLIYNFAFVY